MLDKIKKWVESVGDYQLKNFQEDLKINSKSAKIDLVTNIDQKSEELIIDKIQSNYPGHDIFAEEGGNVNQGSDYRWIVDPLDGTVNFVHGFPIFGISIALYYKEKPKLGLIYYPYFKDYYIAEKDEGSYYNGSRIKTSQETDLSQAMISTGFPYDHQTNNRSLKLFNKILPEAGSIRRTGAAAYDLCQVAAGVFDGFWEIDLKLWDIAAGALLIEEAGGTITDFSGDDVYQNQNREIVAGGFDINSQLRKLLKEEK